MRVLHCGSIDVRTGGPALSIYHTLKGLEKCGIDVATIMPPLSDSGYLIGDDVKIYYTQPEAWRRFGYIKDIKGTLRALEQPQLYHIQGIWQYLGHSIAKYARSRNISYVITLRGMLYPQALAHSRVVKRTALWLYQREDLAKAACIQATCHEEMRYYRALGFKNPVAVLPNPIEVEDIIDIPSVSPDVLRYGYLGRLHERKRVERLIYAFAEICESDDKAELIIIGGGDEKYESFLRSEVARLGLKRVYFKGFLTGAAKDKAIRSLSYLLVPSDFENFGNIVTESLVRGVPVIASKGTPWEILEARKCGWWIENDQNTITDAMKYVMALPETDRLKMGENGKRLMLEQFSVTCLGKKMRNLYEWVLHGGVRPDFVYV